MPETLARDINPDCWTVLPATLRPQIKAYILLGRIPRDPFLVALLANDLQNSVRHAGRYLPWLPDCARFLREEAPFHAWGSGEAMARWELAGGLIGMAEMETQP